MNKMNSDKIEENEAEEDENADLYDDNGNISEETYYANDDDGEWDKNTCFNGEGFPIDEEGNIIESDEYEFDITDNDDIANNKGYNKS